MQISPPYGFDEIVPLDKTQRVALPRTRTLPPVFRRMNPVPVSFTEFIPASRDYPLVFISRDNGRSYSPMAITGLEQRQNLFVLGDNAWDRRAYLPAYVRRYPFCMTRVSVDGKERPERVACVEKSALADKGDALFDDKGEATPEWAALQKLLFEYEADLARTEEFCKVLTLLGLLEPFAMQATPDSGEPLALTGMFRVAEQKLVALEPARLKELTANGVLARIFAHLMSLDNFRRLLERRAALLKKSLAAKPPDRLQRH